MAKPFVDGEGDDVRDAYEDVRSDDSDTNWYAAVVAVSTLASILLWEAKADGSVAAITYLAWDVNCESCVSFSFRAIFRYDNGGQGKKIECGDDDRGVEYEDFLVQLGGNAR